MSLKPRLQDPPLGLPCSVELTPEMIDKALRPPGEDLASTNEALRQRSGGLRGSFDDIEELENTPRR